MKNLLYISILIFFISCKSESKIVANYDKVFPKTTINTDLDQHQLYKGKIITEKVRDKMIFHYLDDNSSIEIAQRDSIYKSLFERGILHSKLFYSSTYICCFKEKIISADKRIYEFSLSRNNFLGLLIYTIELENNKANKNTSSKEFINNITGWKLSKYARVII